MLSVTYVRLTSHESFFRLNKSKKFVFLFICRFWYFERQKVYNGKSCFLSSISDRLWFTRPHELMHIHILLSGSLKITLIFWVFLCYLCYLFHLCLPLPQKKFPERIKKNDEHVTNYLFQMALCNIFSIDIFWCTSNFYILLANC